MQRGQDGGKDKTEAKTRRRQSSVSTCRPTGGDAPDGGHPSLQANPPPLRHHLVLPLATMVAHTGRALPRRGPACRDRALPLSCYLACYLAVCLACSVLLSCRLSCYLAVLPSILLSCLCLGDLGMGGGGPTTTTPSTS